MMIADLFSRAFYSSKFALWCLFWINFLGTLYGYVWYGNQLVYTISHYPLWLIVFVPDSPNASLFFTIALALLLWDSYYWGRVPAPGRHSLIRGMIEAFAVMTSFKYGIWAVVMIFSGAALGDQMIWQDWMLVVSHLGMAIEGFLFLSFFRFRFVHMVYVAGWMLLNDYIDYGIGLYPWLPEVLRTHLDAVGWFTSSLSLVTIAAVYFVYRKSNNSNTFPSN